MMRLIALFTLLAGFTGPALAQQWSAEQLEVWEFEKKCYGVAPGKDRSECFHKDYVGWYSTNPVPLPWDQRMEGLYTDTQPSKFDVLRPHHILVRDNMAVVHYSALSVVEDSDGKLQEVWQHWTDVAVKEDGKWSWIADHGHGTNPQ